MSQVDSEEDAEPVFSLPFLRSNLERSKDAGTWQEGSLLPQTGTISIKCLNRATVKHSTSGRARENHKYI